MTSSVLHRLDAQLSQADPVEVLDDSHPYSLSSTMSTGSEIIPTDFSDQLAVAESEETAKSIEKNDFEVEEASPALLPVMSLPSGEIPSSVAETSGENHVKVGSGEKRSESVHHPLESDVSVEDVETARESSSGDGVHADNLSVPVITRKEKRVSFRSEQDSDLVTDYVSAPDPWRFADESSTQNVMQAYAHMCLHNNVQPLPKVLESIKRNPGGRQRSGVFDLSGETIDLALVDTLEAIFMRMSFEELNLDGCLSDDELAVALMDMLEYYQMTDKLVVSNNKKLQFRGWLAIAKNLKNCCLYYFDARGCILQDQFASLLSRAFRCGTNLVTLHLENCGLSGRPAFLLISALQYSDTVQELFLGDNKLTPNDMIHLASALKHGWRIRVLDLRNNPIMNSGAAHLLDSIDQSSVRALILYNTCVTSQIGKSLAKMLFRSRNLETLNLGSNDLTDETVFAIKEALMVNRSVRRLGLQAAKISDEGCIALAEFVADHPRFLRLDLRHNEIKCGGWLALSHAAKISPSLVRVDMSYDLRDLKHTETIRDSLQLIQATCLENMENFEKSLLVKEPIEEEVFLEEPTPKTPNGVPDGDADSTKITITPPNPDGDPAPPAPSDAPVDMESPTADYPEFIGSFGQAVDTNLDIDIPRKKCTQLGRRRSSISSVSATGPLSICDRLTEELFPTRPPLPISTHQPVIKGRFQISLVKATEKIYASVQSVLSPVVTPPEGAAGPPTPAAASHDGKGLFNWRATFRRGSKEIPQVELPISGGEHRVSPDRADFPGVAVKSST